MKTRSLLVPLIAFVAGLIGGLASRFLPSPSVSDGRFATVRTNRLELIDESGKAKAFLGTTADGLRNTALVFLDGRQQERASFGVWANTATPYMVMKGQEGGERFSLQLAYRTERPVILLRDEREKRAQLGFFPSDYESPGDKSWGLNFYDSGSPYRTLSGIGIGPKLAKVPLSETNPKLPAAIMQGYVVVRYESGHEWSEPK